MAVGVELGWNASPTRHPVSRVDQAGKSAGCLALTQQELIRGKAPNAVDLTNRRVRKGSATEELERLANRAKSRVRARVEHVFGVVKRLWGFNKARYRGLAKKATRSFVALGLANIYLARATLYAQVRP